jgi:EpsI family protein
VCYTGGGDMILDKRVVDMADFKVNSFVSEKDNMKSLVYYWYKAGDKFTINYISQQVNAVLNQLKGNKSTIALIRISTQMRNQDKETASQILQEFSNLIIPIVRKYIP